MLMLSGLMGVLLVGMAIDFVSGDESDDDVIGFRILAVPIGPGNFRGIVREPFVFIASPMFFAFGLEQQTRRASRQKSRLLRGNGGLRHTPPSSFFTRYSLAPEVTCRAKQIR